MAVSAERTPEISVVVPSHNRPLRLRWLLNALEEQTLQRERFEICIADDSGGDESEELMRSHPLAADGTLRFVRLPPAKRGSAGKLRNAGWRMARSPVIAFTDDDCFPPPEWLEQALESARRSPGKIIQGYTLPDPLEKEAERHGPWPHSQHIRPPEPYAQTCNIVYPREALERIDGFLEDPPLDAGEDTDLCLRAQKAGYEYVGDPGVVTWHAVDSAPLWRRLRTLWRWGDLAFLVKNHPEFRDNFPLWVFWKRTHVWLPLAVLGLVLERRRNPLYAALALPWVVHTMPHHGTDIRGRLREYSELPGRAAIDVTEFLALVWGSIKHRSFFI
jgi:glycosyltransferase involved in cell wall biosynthesis